MLLPIVERLGLNLSDGPHGTDKAFPKRFVQRLYDPLVRKLEIRRILEVGVRGGASLRMWSEYLKDVPGGRVIGIDNFSDTQKPRQDWIEESNTQVIEGDAYDSSVVSSFAETFDLIVDDGPHDLPSQIVFLELYSPLLAEGGYLIIEDILGGTADLARLVNSLPRESRMCLWSVDVRRESGCVDALLLVVHNCDQHSKDCAPSRYAKSERGILRFSYLFVSLLISRVRGVLRQTRQ